MILKSIRWRLQAWHGLILVTVLVAFGFTAYQVAWDNQLRRIDQDLKEQWMQLGRPDRPEGPHGGPPDEPPEGPPGRSLGGPGGPGAPPHGRFGGPPELRQHLRDALQPGAGSGSVRLADGYYFILWTPDAAPLRSKGAPEDVPRPAGVSQPGSHRNDPGPGRDFPGVTLARTRGNWREVYRDVPMDGCLLVGRSMASDLAGMRRVALGLSAVGAGILLAGLAGGWWLAARAIRPIQDISAAALKISAGDLGQRISVADTESELGHLADVLNSTFARLDAAFTHQARFTADASHELRTPVAVILAQTQATLARERSGPEYRETLEACQRAAQRMRRLTESLLALARLDAGQEPMRLERLDLARVVRETIELVRPLATGRGLDVQTELPFTECVGDAVRLSQVVTNLVTNALEHTPERGTVRVTVTNEAGYAVLVIADTGEGIPAADLPHVTERFYRIDPARAGATGRSGLGLAIVKAIIDAHGGTLDITSQSGQGTTATVRLPA